MQFKLTPDKLFRLETNQPVPHFDCGDCDLNEFLVKDACGYLSELMTVTYIVSEGADVIAFFSLSNDTLVCDTNPEGRTIWNRLQRTIPNAKRRKSYPAVKLGRLGVSTNCQCGGLGSEILDLLKMWFVSNNKTGCRFITVDAYNKPRTITFYQRNEFTFLTESDAQDDTRLMYFDLKPFHLLLTKTDAS